MLACTRRRRRGSIDLAREVRRELLAERHAAAPRQRRLGRAPSTPTQSRRCSFSTPQARSATSAGSRSGAHQRRGDRRLLRVEAARALAEQRLRERVDADDLAAERHRVEIRLEDLALLPARSSRVAVTAWPSFWPTLRPPRRPRQAVVEQAGELHRQRRRAARARVPEVAPRRSSPPRRQSTPPCSQKRRSSLSTIAVAQRRRDLGERHPGEAPHASCRRARVWSGAPWRSSSVTSDGRCAALTSANVGSACAAPRRAAPRAQRGERARRERRARASAHHGATSTPAFGNSPKISGAYIASTRVGGSAKRPGLFRRTVYSTTCLPRGR